MSYCRQYVFGEAFLQSDNILPKAAHRSEIKAEVNIKPSWVKMIRSVRLLECDAKQIWEEQTVVNVKAMCQTGRKI